MSTIVVALGGNALGTTAEGQIESAQVAASAIADLILDGNQVLVCHGNGPQVGQIRLAFETAAVAGVVPLMPFAECSAMSQGYIGYHLQQAIDEELVSRGHNDIPVISMLTQVVVDPNDPAFDAPTKPIGGYVSKHEAEALMAGSDMIYKEDSGRGWRRVIASPKPVDVYEKMTLKTLTEDNEIVIAGGGGGIPVVYNPDGKHYRGIDAVIDKDLTAAKIAELIDADFLLILTAVEKVYVNFGTPDQKAIDVMSQAEAQTYIEEGQFAPGSMLPKIIAALEFIQARPDGKAVIGSLETAHEAIAGNNGTRIVA